MLLTAQSVQSIGDLFLVRVYNRDDDDVGDNLNQTVNDVDSKAGADFHRNDNCGPYYDGTSIERMPSHEVSSWARTAARLLQEQWPRRDQDKQICLESHADRRDINERIDSNHDAHYEDHGNAYLSRTDDTDEYYRKFIVHHEKSCPRYSLTCSYILVRHNARTSANALVVGHGRLTECYESAGGNAVAATYILVDPEHRGKGYGRTLMHLLEQEVKSKERLGCEYHFVYLWCKTTTAPFYERSGYLPCRNRVSLQRPCLKALTATSVQSLEGILQRHQRHRAAMADDHNVVSNNRKKYETVVLLPSLSLSSQSKKDNGEQPIVEKDVWLRKRLVDHVESITISEEDRRNEIQHFVASTAATKIISTDNSTNTVFGKKNNLNYWYRYRWNPNVPWQMQIGPTCGLTAIRMIRDFYNETNVEHSKEVQEGPTSGALSLLAEARKRGYTDDGEMFDANRLRDLMKDQLLVADTGNFSLNHTTIDSTLMDIGTVKTRETSSLTGEEIDSTIRKRGLWILPYDCNPRTKLPGKYHGKHAHWGIIVGILDASATETGDISEKSLASDNKEQMPNEFLIQQNNLDDDLSLPLLVPKREEIVLKDDGSLTVKSSTSKEANDGFRNTASTTIGNSVYLIVQHSLSSKWAIAPMENWFDSNRQLISVNVDKFALGNKEVLNLSNKVIQVLPS